MAAALQPSKIPTGRPASSLSRFHQIGFEYLNIWMDHLSSYDLSWRGHDKGRLNCARLGLHCSIWHRQMIEMCKCELRALLTACSLLCRTLDVGLAECCHQENVGILAYSPMAMGLLTVFWLPSSVLLLLQPLKCQVNDLILLVSKTRNCHTHQSF